MIPSFEMNSGLNLTEPTETHMIKTYSPIVTPFASISRQQHKKANKFNYFFYREIDYAHIHSHLVSGRPASDGQEVLMPRFHGREMRQPRKLSSHNKTARTPTIDRMIACPGRDPASTGQGGSCVSTLFLHRFPQKFEPH